MHDVAHDEIIDSYNKWAETYDSITNPTRILAVKVINKFLSEFRGKNIIEPGCGTGEITKLFVSHAEHVISFDNAYKMLKKARAKIKSDKVMFFL